MSNSPSTHNAIYSAKANVKKGKYYDVYPRNRNYLSTWSVIDRTKHVRKRRVLSNAFSDRALRSAEQFVIQHVDRWCELLIQGAENSWSEPRNIARWSEFLVFDILTDLCFGKSFELKEPGENELKDFPNKMAASLALHHAVYPFYPLANHRYFLRLPTSRLETPHLPLYGSGSNLVASTAYSKSSPQPTSRNTTASSRIA